MSKALLDSISQLFQPRRPLWACEFTPTHLILAGTDPSRKKIVGKVASELPSKALAGSLSERNLIDRKTVLQRLKDAIAESGYKGSEVIAVLPDDATRIAFMTAESLPASEEERETFIRWKLKKSVPFDADTARIAFTVLGAHGAPDGVKGTDLLVALSPRAIVEEYEQLFASLEIHAGLVMPSTIAALNLYAPPKGDTLFVKVAPTGITTTIFQNQLPKFYRRVSDAGIYDAVYPTIMYYQDKLGGLALNSITVCGYKSDAREDIAQLQAKSGVPVSALEPRNVDDMYKPALGAVDFTWADLI